MPAGRRDQAAPNVRLRRTCHFCAFRARRGNAQCLVKSSPYAGPSAGTEVARLVPSGERLERAPPSTAAEARRRTGPDETDPEKSARAAVPADRQGVFSSWGGARARRLQPNYRSDGVRVISTAVPPVADSLFAIIWGACTQFPTQDLQLSGPGP